MNTQSETEELAKLICKELYAPWEIAGEHSKRMSLFHAGAVIKVGYRRPSEVKK